MRKCKTAKKSCKTVAKTAPAPAVETKAAAPAAPVETAKPAEPKTQHVTFSVRADVGSTVFLAGNFNNWDPSAKQMTDKKNDGLFTTTISLVPGEYQYKFIINGTWCADPECADWVQNEHGTLNSIRRVE
jgi:1,4-alpha-glucan branching enzyme